MGIGFVGSAIRPLNAIGRGEGGVTAWYDRESDSLEVLFEQKEGDFREIDNDTVMETVDQKGHVIGVSLLNVSQNPSESLVSALLRDEAA